MRIAVAGAGPAGLSCAYWAAKEGHRVTIYERSPAERWPWKPCGELLLEEGFSWTPFVPLYKPWILNRVRTALIYCRGSFIRRVPFPPAYVVDKGAFLRSLLSLAESEGARIEFSSPVKPSRLPEADLVVDATGYPGSLARHLGFDYRTYRLVPVLQLYCRAKEEPCGPEEVVIDYLGRGYAWIFPRGDAYNVGLGGFYRRAELEALLEALLKRYGLEAVGRPRGAAVSVGGPIKELRRGRVAVAGEAAGMVMPTTGEGMRFALWSGAHCFKPDYERLFRALYGRKMERARWILEATLRMDPRARGTMLELDEALRCFWEGTVPPVGVVLRALRCLRRSRVSLGFALRFLRYFL